MKTLTPQDREHLEKALEHYRLTLERAKSQYNPLQRKLLDLAIREVVELEHKLLDNQRTDNFLASL